ncbi:MAG TPA: branched-chain amino acid ABC transporter permease [Casimicrobiaceae bacterium]|nr:branched-chain amino acid ABC transporter permease [Casimicrobiaceae bacterium]
MEQVAQQIINWLALSSIYALLAIGFSLLFGVINVIQFSHGDVALTAPFIAMAVFASLGALAPGAGLFLAIIVAIFAVGMLGILLDRLLIRRFRTAPPMMALVATVALGIVLRELIRILYPDGSNPHPFPLLIEGNALTFGEAALSWLVVTMMGVTALLVAALTLLLYRTRLGVRIRAVSQDIEMARMLAINPNRVFQGTFFIASVTGAVAGVFYASYVGLMRFDLGIIAGLLGFSAAVIGGLGNMTGAIIGSLVLAGLDTMVQAALPDGAAYRLVVAFFLVVLVLVFRPAGLLGQSVPEKV